MTYIVEELPSCTEHEFRDLDKAREYAAQSAKDGESDTVRVFQLLESYTKGGHTVEPDPVRKAARSLLSDIDAMRCNVPDEEARDDVGDSGHWFAFHDFDTDIEWPNLSISAEQLRKALEYSEAEPGDGFVFVER